MMTNECKNWHYAISLWMHHLWQHRKCTQNVCKGTGNIRSYSSTKEKPHHNDCPEGPKNWCSYQRDKSSCNIDLCTTEKYFVKVVMFIFNHLDNQGFLEGCKNIKTECQLVLQKIFVVCLCPKEQFNFSMTMSFAVSLPVCLYNSGLQCSLTNLLKNRIGSWYLFLKALAQYWQDYGVIDTWKEKPKLKKNDQKWKKRCFQKSEGIQ